MRREQLAFFIVLLVGASILFFALPKTPTIPSRLGLASHRLSFGSSGIESVGWLMPANTLISTSYVANQSLYRFIVGSLNVFPYQIQQGTILYLSLYLNSQLASTQQYNMSVSYKTPAAVVGNIKNGVASFTNSLLTFTVSEFPLTTTLPVGTIMTVTAWVSHPVWVQIDETSLAHSYETSVLASHSSPSAVLPETGSISPHTLSVGLESSAT